MPSRLILVRHGESVWNLENRITGWVDVSLSPRGMEEAARVGELLAGERLDVAFTSTLIRAWDTLYEILRRNRPLREDGRGWIRVLEEAGSPWYGRYHRAPADGGRLQVHASERLNERCYGDLQGLNKDEARRRFGEEQVHLWRRSYDVAPPGGESLADTAERVMPYFRERIVPELERRGRTVLVVAHGNSLRALAMHMEGMSREQILRYEIPTGVPHVYTFRAGPRGLVLEGKEVLQTAA